MQRIVISQPMYFPWPGFFEQLMLADAYLWLDDVQFSKGSFTNRVQIGVGDVQKWMTVPLEGKGAFTLIKDLATASDFRADHLARLSQAYRDAPFAADALEIARQVFAETNLCDLLVASVEVPAGYLDLPTRTQKRTSALEVPGTSWRRVRDLVLACGGTHYLTGHGAVNYLDHEAFAAAGVTVEYMAYSKAIWPRQGALTTPYLSILDLIAYQGPAASTFLRPATSDWRTFIAERNPVPVALL